MTKTFTPRATLVDQLVARDGLVCKHPDCGRPLDLSIVQTPEGKDNPLQVTIDHREPQVWCRENGWTEEQIWDLSNLDLMHKKCNADKGSRRYIADGVLEPKPVNRFRYRRQKRAERPEICTSCNAGRDLGPNEVCASCNSGPMPQRYPRWAKVPSKECDHELFWCWACASGIVDRMGATEMILLGGEGGEQSPLTEPLYER